MCAVLPRKVLFLLPASLLSVALAGCALTAIAPSTPESFQGSAIQGQVHGGQQPIKGAHVFLFAASTSGYGTPSVSLLKVTGSNTVLDSVATDATFGDYYVLTDANGGFNITGDYTCNAGDQVYLYALGGDSGAGANTAIGLMAALGSCPGTGNFLASNPFIQINEVTTIAAAYALSGFAVDATHVASSGTALAKVDIANAFTNASNLVSIVTGNTLTYTPGSVGAPGTFSYGNVGTVPRTEINSLGNILAACVNSSAGFTPCITLFGDAQNGSVTPTDTASAAINIAHHPGANVLALYNLSTASAPFQTALTSVPNDWTIALNFTIDLSGNTLMPYGLAIDAAGQVWVVNSNTIIKLSPSGVVLNGVGYFGGNISYPIAIAIDNSGDAWVANLTGNSVTGFAPNGSVLSGAGYAAGANPYSIAIDAANNLWVANSAYQSHSASNPYSVSELSSATGANLNGSPFLGGGLNTPEAIAIDTAGSAWVANLGAYATQISSSGTVTAYNNPGPLTFISPNAVAIDSSGNKWFGDEYGSNNYGYYITELTGSGSGFVDNTFSTQGLQMSQNNITIDGAGNVWVTTFGFGNANYSNWVGEFSPSGTLLTPPNGFHDPNLLCEDASGMAIDGAGDVWVSCGGPGALMEYVGAATPVVTPIVANLSAPYSKAASKP